MKYKVNEGTELYAKIEQVFQQIRSANEAALKLALSYGATDFKKETYALGGGITSLRFKSAQDEKIWRKNGTEEFEYMPNKKRPLGKVYHDQIRRLKPVMFPKIWQLFCIDEFFGTPGIKHFNGGFLIEFTRKYDLSAVEDLIKISDIEFKQLSVNS